MYVFRFTIVTLVAFLTASNSAVTHWMGKQTGCYADTIAANPNRPTVTNPAHVTQDGVLEVEYGWDRLWPEESIHQTSIGGLLKFGMLCDIELRWNTISFLSQTDATGTYGTFGDNWLGTELRVHRQTKRLPTMAFSYALKIPSASTGNGLGTGRVDHSFAIATYGFDSVWFRGVWERSPAGIAIANQNKGLLADFRRALPDFRPEDNVGSPYCVRRYVVDAHLEGPPIADMSL